MNLVDSHWLAEIIWVQKTFGMIHSNTSKNFAVLSEYFMSTSNSSKLVFKISEIWVEWIVIFFVKWIHFWTLLQLLLFSCWQLYFWGYFKIYIWYLSFFCEKSITPFLWRYLDHLHDLLQTDEVDFLAISLKNFYMYSAH